MKILLRRVISTSITVGGVIGPQTLPNGTNTPGNMYVGYDNAGTFYHSATNSIKSLGGFYDFWVNSGVYLPLSNTVTGVGATAINPFIPTGYTPFSCPSKCYNHDLTATIYPVDEMEEVLNSMPTFTSFDELTKWLMEKGLYEKLKEHPELIDSSLLLKDFVDSTEINNKGKLGDVSIALSYIFDESTGTLTPTIIETRIEDAESKNSGISPLTIFESNQKIVNSIILSSIARGRYEFTETELMNLEDIADQCPYLGGPSVFEARSLLLLTNAELTWNDEVICEGTSERHSLNESKYSYLSVYPNPATEFITLEYDLESYSKARIYIVDVNGKVRKELSLNTKDYSVNLDISDLNSGVYFMKLMSEDDLIRVEKVTIIR